MNADHFRRLVIDPTLQRLGLWSPAAAQLLLGTALTESRLQFLQQIGGGPARGVYQIEPATRTDVHKNVLRYRYSLRNRVKQLMTDQPADDQLVTNLAYQTAIARLCYWRQAEPLPAADDLVGLARYWKTYFNTVEGAGHVDDFVAKAGPFLTDV